MQKTRTLLLALTASAFILRSAPAAAQQCGGGVRYPVAVQARCSATLQGTSGIAKTFEALGRRSQLDVGATSANLSFGDYSLGANLVCSGNEAMQFKFEVRFTHKSRPFASPIHFASLSNLLLPARRNLAPIVVESYAFLEPVFTLAGVNFTRVDYKCELGVSDLPAAP